MELPESSRSTQLLRLATIEGDIRSLPSPIINSKDGESYDRSCMITIHLKKDHYSARNRLDAESLKNVHRVREKPECHPPLVGWLTAAPVARRQGPSALPCSVAITL